MDKCFIPFEKRLINESINTALISHHGGGIRILL